MSDYLATWLDHQRDELRPASWSRYDVEVRHRIVPALGDRPLWELSVEDVRAARQTWGQTPSAAFALRVLTGALNDAEADGKIARNPARLVDPPRLERTERPEIGPDLLLRIFEAFEGDWMYPIVVTAGACGLRRGEVLGLHRRNLDFEGFAVMVEEQVRHVPLRFRSAEDDVYQLRPTKTRKSRRIVPMLDLAARALQAHLDRKAASRDVPLLRPDDELVFSAAGGPLNPNRVTRRFEVVMERAKITGVTFHDLRHGQATLMAEAGVDSRVRQAILGHTDEEMTARYTAATWDMLRDAAARMNERLAKPARTVSQ